MSDGAPRLDGVRFAVLALGDTAYAQFCETGKRIDARLEALGATRAADRVDCDLDYAKKANEWTEATFAKLAPADAGGGATIVHVDFKSGGAQAEDDDEPRFSAENPLEAEIATLINLNGTGSTRETLHVEFASEEPGFTYQPGDAIGVVAENDPELVDQLLQATGLVLRRAAAVEDPEGLRRHDAVEISGRELRQARRAATDVKKLLEGDAYAKFSSDRQLVDLFETYKEKLSSEQLLSLLRPLPGRLYSVASSQKAHPGEAHLLVGVVRWDSHGHKRKGVASTFLADRRRAGGTARIYVKPNRHFRLPEDGNRPVIMIGSGTGVAPYRGFIEERVETGAKGKSWLFFGERNYTNDFLYQLEWQDHLAAGALTQYRRRLLARSAGEDLRAASPLGAPRGNRELDRGRRAPLRLRRRAGHGQGRRSDAGQDPCRSRQG